MARAQRNILMVGGADTEIPDLFKAMESLAPGWSWHYAADGLTALDELTCQEFSAVVTDLRLADLSGLQLLNQVMSQWPTAHRVILADLGDMEALLSCVGGLHQFLARPCEAPRLSAVLSRAFRLDVWLPNVTVRRLLGRLPSLPSVAGAYHATIDDLEHGRLSSTAERVAGDPAMAAKILQLANSAAYGPPLDESDPARAVRELGLANVRHVLLLAHTYSEFRDLKNAGFEVELFVAHAQRTSEAARRIAQVESASAELTERASAAGLLHNLGKLALAVNLPEKVGEVRRIQEGGAATTWEAEQKVFGATHGEVAGSLLGLWGLPMEVIEAVAFHHHPACFLNEAFSPLTAVHVGRAFIQAESFEAAQERLDLRYLSTVRVEERLPLWWEAVRSGTEAGMHP